MLAFQLCELLPLSPFSLVQLSPPLPCMNKYIVYKAVNREDKRSRRYRDRDFAKFERSRRYRDR
jgi:hypothetical protein